MRTSPGLSQSKGSSNPVSLFSLTVPALGLFPISLRLVFPFTSFLSSLAGSALVVAPILNVIDYIYKQIY